MTDSSALQVVEGFLAAANRHDAKTALAFLSDDFRFRETDDAEGVDKTWMADLFGWDRRIESQASYQKLALGDDGTVSGEFAETNCLYRELGLNETRCALRFRVAEGKIVEQTIEQVLGDGPTFGEALEPFFLWAEEFAPDDLDAIQPDGEIVFTAEMAKLWMALLAKWKSHDEG